jgi:hypothetical protein
VLLASKGGSQDQLDYYQNLAYQNLAANPKIAMTIDGRTIRMRTLQAGAIRDRTAGVWHWRG